MAKIFISYDYYTDGSFVNGIRGMIYNPNINIDFIDGSIQEPINSPRADYIKNIIRDRINACSILLCIVGRNTHSSEWVKWEVIKAHELGKKLIFMRPKGDYVSVLPWLNPLYIIQDWNVDYLKTL